MYDIYIYIYIYIHHHVLRQMTHVKVTESTRYQTNCGDARDDQSVTDVYSQNIL